MDDVFVLNVMQNAERIFANEKVDGVKKNQSHQLIFLLVQNNKNKV